MTVYPKNDLQSHLWKIYTNMFILVKSGDFIKNLESMCF